MREFVSSPESSTSRTSTPKGKGKDKDSRKEAFIPENVYDAMKENKRFDSMRVSRNLKKSQNLRQAKSRDKPPVLWERLTDDTL